MKKKLLTTIIMLGLIMMITACNDQENNLLLIKRTINATGDTFYIDIREVNNTNAYYNITNVNGTGNYTTEQFPGIYKFMEGLFT